MCTTACSAIISAQTVTVFPYKNNNNNNKTWCPTQAIKIEESKRWYGAIYINASNMVRTSSLANVTLALYEVALISIEKKKTKLNILKLHT